MWIYLLLLSLRDLKSRSIALGSIAFVIIATAATIYSKHGMVNAAEIIAVSSVLSAVLFAPLVYLKAMGPADAFVEYAIVLNFLQQFPWIPFVLMLSNFWFLTFNHFFIKKHIPFIPFISIITLLAVSFIPR